MHRFFIAELGLKSIGDIIELEGDDARHGVTVLRLKRGESVIVCDGRGGDYICEVRTAKNGVSLSVTGTRANEAEPGVKVYLFQALLKYDKLEYAAQKAVELGVSGFYTFQSERSVARLTDNPAKQERLRKIVRSAACQSGRGVIPQCADAADFGTAVAASKSFCPDMELAAHEGAVTTLKQSLRDAKAPKTITLFIGPEGGFSQAETGIFEGRGIRAFSLGKRILRAETAGIASLSSIIYELDG